MLSSSRRHHTTKEAITVIGFPGFGSRPAYDCVTWGVLKKVPWKTWSDLEKRERDLNGFIEMIIAIRIWILARGYSLILYWLCSSEVGMGPISAGREKASIGLYRSQHGGQILLFSVKRYLQFLRRSCRAIIPRKKRNHQRGAWVLRSVN